MKLLQIDSVNALVRSHYLPVFSRIGPYDRTLLDRQASAPNQKKRSLFEYWAHEASLLPVEFYPLLRWRMRRAGDLEGVYQQIKTLKNAQPQLVQRVYDEVRERGPLSARELKSSHGKAGWWEWSTTKTALEYWFWAGELAAVGRRNNFERIYDITERVLPAEVLNKPVPTDAQAIEALVAHAAEALGIASETDLRDYFRLPAAATSEAIEALVDAGQLQMARVEKWPKPGFLAIRAKDRPVRAIHRLLSPFDPLVWHRDRAERLFGFRYRLEIYTPEKKRQYGYYVLPFLHAGRLSARVDCRADRRSSTLNVPAAYLEPDRNPLKLSAALAGELAHLASWLNLERVRIGRRGNLAATLRNEIKHHPLTQKNAPP